MNVDELEGKRWTSAAATAATEIAAAAAT